MLSGSASVDLSAIPGQSHMKRWSNSPLISSHFKLFGPSSRRHHYFCAFLSDVKAQAFYAV